MFTPVTLQSCEPRVVACESGKTSWASGLAAGSRAREHDDEHRRHRPPKGSRIRGAVAGLTKQGNAWCSASARMDTNGCLDRPLHPGPWIPRRTGACGSVHGIAHACGNGASVSRCVCVCVRRRSKPPTGQTRVLARPITNIQSRLSMCEGLKMPGEDMSAPGTQRAMAESW